MNSYAAGQPTYDGPDPSAAPAGRRPWLRWLVAAAVVAAAFAGGTVLGVVTTDPTASDEYRALEDDLADAEDRIDTADAAARDAEAAAVEAARLAEDTIKSAEETLSEQAAELDARAKDVAAREKAVTAVEERIADTSIGQGVWTVGVDVEPGSYRTADPLIGDCYWSITVSGTNGSDIVENDIPSGGYPTVTLRAGQDFENNGCGTFVKQ